ncbi:MAG: isochorismatase family cysteine hydrolase [Rhodocyclaceae bacterium]
MNSNAALLIVDVQRGFINHATAHIPERVEALQTDYPLVVVTRFVNPPDSNYRRLIHWTRFTPGSDDTLLAFGPRGDAVIVDKPRYTCVTPDFLALLARHGIAEVHVCGINTDICVTKCAVDLFEAGLRPVVLANACASHAGNDYHEAALRILTRFIGREQIRR